MAYAHLLFLAALPKRHEAEAVAAVRAHWPSPDGVGDVAMERLNLTILPLAQTLRAAELTPTSREVVARLSDLPAQEAFGFLLERAESLSSPGLEGRAPFTLAVGRGKGAVNGVRRRLRAALGEGVHPTFANWKGGDPHVTLSWRLDRIERTMLETPVTWAVSEIALIHSHRGDSRHDIVASWPLIPIVLH